MFLNLTFGILVLCFMQRTGFSCGGSLELRSFSWCRTEYCWFPAGWWGFYLVTSWKNGGLNRDVSVGWEPGDTVQSGELSLLISI